MFDFFTILCSIAVVVFVFLIIVLGILKPSIEFYIGIKSTIKDFIDNFFN